MCCVFFFWFAVAMRVCASPSSLLTLLFRATYPTPNIKTTQKQKTWDFESAVEHGCKAGETRSGGVPRPPHRRRHPNPRYYTTPLLALSGEPLRFDCRSLVTTFLVRGMQHEVCVAVQYACVWPCVCREGVVVRYLVFFFLWRRREGGGYAATSTVCFAECMTRVDGARCRYVSWLTGNAAFRSCSSSRLAACVAS